MSEKISEQQRNNLQRKGNERNGQRFSLLPDFLISVRTDRRKTKESAPSKYQIALEDVKEKIRPSTEDLSY